MSTALRQGRGRGLDLLLGPVGDGKANVKANVNVNTCMSVGSSHGGCRECYCVGLIGSGWWMFNVRCAMGEGSVQPHGCDVMVTPCSFPVSRGPREVACVLDWIASHLSEYGELASRCDSCGLRILPPPLPHNVPSKWWVAVGFSRS